MQSPAGARPLHTGCQYPEDVSRLPDLHISTGPIRAKDGIRTEVTSFLVELARGCKAAESTRVAAHAAITVMEFKIVMLEILLLA
jgi:hypothetical protein